MIPALAQAALDPAISGRTMQVYVYLIGQLDTYQFRPIKITQTAHVMKIKRPNLSRALTLLIERGYLEAQKDGDDERRHVYRLVNSLPEVVRNQAA